MGRELREGLAFLQGVALAMFFLRGLAADLEDAEALGIPDVLERLMTTEPVSREAWQLLARVVRHLLTAAEDRLDPRVLLLRELHRETMRHVDRTAAASARQNGVHDHGDDDTEV